MGELKFATVLPIETIRSSRNEDNAKRGRVMEISPIPGIRSLPVMKTPRAEADLSRVFDIVNSTPPDDDTYNGSSKKGPGGQDGEPEPTEEPEGIEELQALSEAPSTQPVEETDRTPADPSLGVNYFA